MSDTQQQLTNDDEEDMDAEMPAMEIGGEKIEVFAVLSDDEAKELENISLEEKAMADVFEQHLHLARGMMRDILKKKHDTWNKVCKNHNVDRRLNLTFIPATKQIAIIHE